MIPRLRRPAPLLVLAAAAAALASCGGEAGVNTPAPGPSTPAPSVAPGALQPGAPEHGTSEHGTSRHGASQHGTSQHGASDAKAGSLDGQTELSQEVPNEQFQAWELGTGKGALHDGGSQRILR